MKEVFGIVAGIATIIAFIPYVKDIIQGNTEPHLFTWLIGGITQTTATIGMFQEGAGYGLIPYVCGTVLIYVIIIFAFQKSTKNITTFDFYALSAALTSLTTYLTTINARIGVMMASLTEVFAYTPTLRQAYQHPKRETLSTWILFSIGGLLSIIAIKHYNWGTLSYATTLTILDIIIVIILLKKRFK